MYPERAELTFDCACPVPQRKNVWSDVLGVHVRYCPICGERRESFYLPTEKWADTGRGQAGHSMPPDLAAKKVEADAERKKGVKVRNPIAA